MVKGEENMTEGEPQDMNVETRKFMVNCPSCGHEHEVYINTYREISMNRVIGEFKKEDK